MYSRYLYSFQGRKRRRKDRGLWATLAERNSMETQNTIGIAGVGKMGEALVRGLIVGRVVPASRVLVSDAIPARAKEIAAKHGVTSLETVADLFGAVVRVRRVEEPMLDAVTGLSGSGPGFIAALAHSMIEGGVRSGLPRDVAYKLALQTMKGTAELLLIDGLEPMQLFRMVATPNGTTEAGWAVMEKRGGPHAISDAIVAASKRAAGLSAGCAAARSRARGHRRVLRRMRPRVRRLQSRLRWRLRSRGISSDTSVATVVGADYDPYGTPIERTHFGNEAIGSLRCQFATYLRLEVESYRDGGTHIWPRNRSYGFPVPTSAARRSATLLILSRKGAIFDRSERLKSSKYEA